MPESSGPAANERSPVVAFLCYDPLPVGGIAVALMLGTGALLGVPPDVPLLAAAFCGTALVYWADRSLGLSSEDRINRPGRLRWVRRHRLWLGTEAAVLMAGLLFSAPLLEGKTVFASVLLGGVGLLHVVPLSAVQSRTTRVLKPVSVAAVWAGGAVLLPVLEAGGSLSAGAAGLAVYRFLLVLPNVLVADWADRAGDAAAGPGSWATGWSRRRLLILATVVLLVGMGGAALAVWAGRAPPLLLLDAAGGLLLLGGLWGLRPERSARHMFLLDLAVAWPGVVWGIDLFVWG